MQPCVMTWFRLTTNRRSPHLAFLAERFPVEKPDDEWRQLEMNSAQSMELGPWAWLDLDNGNTVLIEAVGPLPKLRRIDARIWIAASNTFVDLLPVDPLTRDNPDDHEFTQDLREAATKVYEDVVSIEVLGLPRH